MDQITQVLQIINELREENASLKAAVESQSTTAFQELREDNTTLKLTIDSLIKSQAEIQDENTKMKVAIESLTKSQAGRGASANGSQQSEFSAFVSAKEADVSMRNPDDQKELRDDAHCHMKSLIHGEEISEIIELPITQYDAGGSQQRSSKYFNKTLGVYTTPISGRYRFKVRGVFFGEGKLEWFIRYGRDHRKSESRPIQSCDESDNDSDSDSGTSSDSDSSERETERQISICKDGKRVSLFVLLGNGEGKSGEQERYIVLNAKPDTSVWLELSQKDSKISVNRIFSEFSVCLL